TGLTASEVASRTGLSRPAAVRLLEALVSDSIVIRDPRTKKYHLGLRLHEWATKVAHALTPLSIARRELIRLTSDCRRSFYLFVLEETDAVMVECTEYLDGQALTKPISTHMPRGLCLRSPPYWVKFRPKDR